MGKRKGNAIVQLVAAIAVVGIMAWWAWGTWLSPGEREPIAAFLASIVALCVATVVFVWPFLNRLRIRKSKMTIVELRNKIVVGSNDQFTGFLVCLEQHPENLALKEANRFVRQRTEKATRGATFDETCAWFRSQFSNGEAILLQCGENIFG